MRIKKLNAWAVTPTYGSDGAACFDFYSTEDDVVPANGAKVFGTGLAVEVPPGFALMIYSRSGHGFNSGLRLANCVGVIDSDYRGEIKVKLTNDTNVGRAIMRGERIAQGMLIPVSRTFFEVVDDLTETVRGEGGFGSTGK